MAKMQGVILQGGVEKPCPTCNGTHRVVDVGTSNAGTKRDCLRCRIKR